MRSSKNILKILAVETSCDETAVAVVEVKSKKYRSYEVNSKNKFLDTKILSNIVSSQIKIHRKYGGIFPEMASRAHTEKIIPVVEEALKSAEDKSNKVIKVMKYHTNNLITNNSLLNSFDAIAVTTGPGLIGSLLVGTNFAKTLSYVTRKPIIGINHWLGHIYSCFAGEGKFKMGNGKLGNPNLASRLSNIPQFPSLVLIVSGGHTGLVLMKSHNHIQTLGETLDDAAGEAFDKVAKLLGLGYPGGPAVSAAAEKFKMQKSKIKMKMQNVKFPRSMLDREDFNFSFSGLKTAVLYKVKELTNHYPLTTIHSDIAAEFQQTVIDILIGKTLQAARKYEPKSICLCGGVSANKELREQMTQAIKLLNHNQSCAEGANHVASQVIFHVPPMELTTDNAAMIGVAAAYQLTTNKRQLTTFDKICADANLRL